MSRIAPVLTFALLIAAPAFGQLPADARVFHFVHTNLPEGFEEVARAMSPITDTDAVSVVTGSKALAVRGPVARFPMAEWLFRALDQPPGGSAPGKLEFPVPGETNDIARVFYLVHAGIPQRMEEVAKAIRWIGDIPRVVHCNQPRAIVVRGTAAQIALAEWVIKALDKPAGSPPSPTQSLTLTTPEFRRNDGSPTVAKVLYPPSLKTPRHLEEATNMLRTVAQIQRVLTHPAVGAIILQGSADQVALAERLVNSLDQPPAQ